MVIKYTQFSIKDKKKKKKSFQSHVSLPILNFFVLSWFSDTIWSLQ